MTSETGKYIMLLGALIMVVGLVIYFFNDKMHWIGHLPGDIWIEKKEVKFYFPLATMLLLSLVISALLYILKKN
jgi:H+/Cl- antiporter ClcA